RRHCFPLLQLSPRSRTTTARRTLAAALFFLCSCSLDRPYPPLARARRGHHRSFSCLACHYHSPALGRRPIAAALNFFIACRHCHPHCNSLAPLAEMTLHPILLSLSLFFLPSPISRCCFPLPSPHVVTTTSSPMPVLPSPPSAIPASPHCQCRCVASTFSLLCLLPCSHSASTAESNRTLATALIFFLAAVDFLATFCHPLPSVVLADLTVALFFLCMQ
ncbi:hypothetical protein B296_00015874, partial [Ensete ventricosum]